MGEILVLNALCSVIVVVKQTKNQSQRMLFDDVCPLVATVESLECQFPFSPLTCIRGILTVWWI